MAKLIGSTQYFSVSVSKWKYWNAVLRTFQYLHTEAFNRCIQFLSSMLWNKAPISPFVFFAPDWQCLNSLQSTGSFSSWVFVFDICMKIFEIGKFLPMRFPLPTSHPQPWLLIVMQWNGLYFHFNPRCIITELRLPGMKALKNLKKISLVNSLVFSHYIWFSILLP